MTRSILVVDDEKGQREILQTILEKEGYRVACVAGGKEALARLDEEEFDLILTDLKMQGMSGLELLDQVLADNAGQCVIIMTAHGTVDSAVEAMKLGAFDFIEKPPDSERILIAARNALGQKRLAEENRRLKEMVADLSLDKEALKTVIRKNGWSL